MVRGVRDTFAFALTEYLVVLDDDLEIRELDIAAGADVISFCVTLVANEICLRDSPVDPPHTVWRC